MALPLLPKNEILPIFHVIEDTRFHIKFGQFQEIREKTVDIKRELFICI